MRVGAVLCARNEEHVVEEWVSHHLALGLARIHIFDHMSTDRTREKLEKMHAVIPAVTVESWNPPTDVQRLAYNRGLEVMAQDNIDWCAFIDADEFIANGNPTSSESFSDMLARHEDHSAIAIHWAVFGSSGHIKRPRGLIQENFLYRADDEFGPNRHIKSIVRPRYTKGAYHAHGFALETPYYDVYGQEVHWRLPYAYTVEKPDLNGWRVNHYFCQWRERWDAKIERSKVRGAGSVARNEGHWIEHDRNEVFDPSALGWLRSDIEVLLKATGQLRCLK